MQSICEFYKSPRAHITGKAECFVYVGPLLEQIPDWGEYLNQADADDALAENIHWLMWTGRPMGDERFPRWIETWLGCNLHLGKPRPISALQQ